MLAGLGTFGVALFHVASLVTPSISEPSPPWRHALFVGVNAFFGWAFLTRAAWLPVPFGILCGQQLYSHGSDLLAARAAGRMDWQSVAVLVTLPVVGVLVGLGRKA